MQLFCMCHRVLPFESLISGNISSQNDRELSEWPWKQIKTKRGYALPSPPNWRPRTWAFLTKRKKNTNVIGICGKHDQHWSPPFKRNEHNLAEVQRRGMKKVRLDGWYQRREGAGFIRHGIAVAACNDQAKHTAHHGLPCHSGLQGCSFLLQQEHCKGLLEAMVYPEPWVRATAFA